MWIEMRFAALWAFAPSAISRVAFDLSHKHLLTLQYGCGRSVKR